MPNIDTSTIEEVMQKSWGKMTLEQLITTLVILVACLVAVRLVMALTYFVANHVQIELYTKLKDPASEDNVEEALSSVFWEKSQTYLDTEKCYQTIYEIEV